MGVAAVMQGGDGQVSGGNDYRPGAMRARLLVQPQWPRMARGAERAAVTAVLLTVAVSVAAVVFGQW